ncbi:MAG TPA: SRPBCC family protein [Gemmatimonadales bacterium]|jgi:ribosome-associated toxin RatA of RatAB toxin-antitoxin module
MRTVDRAVVRATLERVFAVAVDVERWPRFLPHYRWVRVLERRPPGAALVEMAAWRPFGPGRWPTRWVSEMEPDTARRRIRYRHVGGITRGMDVEWRIEGSDGAVHVEIVHAWSGPRWPLIGRLTADWVIGPVFIHGIASRTLAGVRREAERR